LNRSEGSMILLLVDLGLAGVDLPGPFGGWRLGALRSRIVFWEYSVRIPRRRLLVLFQRDMQSDNSSCFNRTWTI
jgi:hypothetical protein